VIAVLDDDDLVARAAGLGAMIRDRCRVGPVVRIQGRGLLVGLELDREAADVLAALRARGILAGASSDPRVIRLMPPLVLAEDDVEELGTALEEIG